MIKGWQKTSLIEYEPYTASVIFTGGCNFRCGYCQNPDLVLDPSMPDIPEVEILDYLAKKKNWLDGVCITGGEPTIHKDLPELIARIKALGYRVKLDTNGSNPEMIVELIKKHLIDYIAMDVKTILDNYDEFAGAMVDKENIQKSIDLIKNSGIDYEFRTTVIPGIVGKEEIIQIGEWLRGNRFVIQNFRATAPLIDDNLRKIEPFSEKELEEMKKAVEKYFDEVKIRN